MKKLLLLVGGISEKPYVKDALKASKLYNHFLDQYDCIAEIDYQKILDKRAMCFKTLGDPLRYMVSHKSVEVRELIESFFHAIPSDYECDILTHSLGGWVLEECDISVNRWYSFASAVGWFLPFGRWSIGVRIGKPKIEFKHRLWFYSGKDLVSNSPPVSNSKYTINTEFIKVNTSHDLKEYLDNNIIVSKVTKLK